MGNFVPAFEILFEDFCCVGWFFFFSVGIYSNAASSHSFLESSIPCSARGFVGWFFFSKPLFSTAPLMIFVLWH